MEDLEKVRHVQDMMAKNMDEFQQGGKCFFFWAIETCVSLNEKFALKLEEITSGCNVTGWNGSSKLPVYYFRKTLYVGN